MSPNRASHGQPAPSATPELERLLARLGSSLARQVWMHGSGTVLAAVCAWLAFAFFADWALHVPVGVRWMHVLVLVALPIFFGWRELVRHLRRMPSRPELAVLIERAHPELKELLVSAVELQRSPEGSPELIRRVLRDAEASASRMSLAGVLNERPQRLRFAGGLAAVALLAIVAGAQPELASIFVARLLGSNTPWPKRTLLEVAVPIDGALASLHASEGELEIKVARGTDVPVHVRAAGVVPDEVTLHFQGGDSVVVGAGADRSFRTLLRACQADVAFHVTGGDDRDAEPRVRVIVLEPPDVAGVAVTITAPAYADLPVRTEIDRDVEVLAGSRVSVAMLPDPPHARGNVRLLPEDRLIELAPAEFPSSEPGGAPRSGLGFEFVAEQSLRYRFELTDDTGLSNPDPGLFGVQVVADRRPEVELVAPGRAEVETIASGALRLRARASDDFGVDALGWRARDVARSETLGELTAFELNPLPAAASGDEAQARSRVVGGTRLDVAALAAPASDPEAVPAALETGAQFEIQVVARDNRPPLADGSVDPASLGNATLLRVRVLGADEFLRRLQDRLARLRVQAAELDELQRQKTNRAKELLAALESDQPQIDSGTHPLGAVLTGQRRVQGDAEALTRELAGVLEGVLYARIDEKAGALLEDLDLRLAQASAKGFQLAAWRGLIESWHGGQLATTGLAAQLLAIVDLSVSISADDAPAVCAALAGASEQAELERLHAELTRAIEGQVVLQQHLALLLDRLAEWDNFQSILSLARDILSRQKSLRDRTKDILQRK